MKHLFVIVFRARPHEAAPDFKEDGGAFVTAWVDARTEREAMVRAERGIADAHWIVETVEGIHHLDRSDFKDDPENLAHFDQAIFDGEALVFDTWPNEVQEGDTIH